MDINSFFGTNPKRFYPTIKISQIQNPNRLFAIPLIGFIVKVILMIPVGLWMLLLSIALVGSSIINSFVVLLTGKYWRSAYEFNLGFIRYSIKLSFYFFGLINKYPWFSLDIKDDYTVDIPYPTSPNRLYAIPVVGGLFKVILLIPYIIYEQILSNGTFIASAVASIVVLFKGKYTESGFEIIRDSSRVSQGGTAYILGLSDTYPSFYMSFNHKAAKIVYLVLGLLTSLSNYSENFQQANK